MNRDRTRREELNRTTEQIIGGAFTVSNELGSGFLEKVYENALAHELRKAGIRVEQQYPLKVHYDGIVVGNYVADLRRGLRSGRAKGNQSPEQHRNGPMPQLPQGDRFARLSVAQLWSTKS